MTLAQARKMRDGVLKGDSAIARAWKELITGEAAAPSDKEAFPLPAAASSWDEVGKRKIQEFIDREESF